MQKSQIKKSKIILLLILMLSSIFVIGCSTHGKKDTDNVVYEFCPGKFFLSASEANNMIYYAVNQSTVSGGVKDPNNVVIDGSGFQGPINPADDNNGMWVADGFYEITDKKYGIGTYTLYFSTKSNNYNAQKELKWDNFPTWRSTPNFNTASANTTSRMIYVDSSGITTGENTTGYDINYRIKVYLADKTVSRLFGQSKGSPSYTNLYYTLPKVPSSIRLVPVLVCEMSKNGKIEKILYYPGPSAFTYNP